MRVSSPPIAMYAHPFKGMDTRKSKAIDSPSLLLNVDLSDKGILKERPGVKIFASPSLIIHGYRVAGIHSYVHDGEFFLFSIVTNRVNQSVHLVIFAEDGSGKAWYRLNTSDIITGHARSHGGVTATDDIFYLEPYNDKLSYSFASASRFVFFGNGEGHFWRIEILDQNRETATPTNGQGRSFTVKANVFELGTKSLINSYITSNLKPSAMAYFYGQLILSGFKKSQLCSLSKVIPPKEEKLYDVPAEDLLDTQRTVLSVAPGCVFICEPYLYDSFPVEDPGGFYRVMNEAVIAVATLKENFFMFGRDNLYKTMGHGSTKPQVVNIQPVSIAGHSSFCYFKSFIFFVATDGCYVIDGNSAQKISKEMDSLWFGTDVPQTTRYVSGELSESAYPFIVNKKALHNAKCINDKDRQQIMVSLPGNGSISNNMVWVFNYSDLVEGVGPGKWSIWCSNEEPVYQGTRLAPGTPFADAAATDPALVSNTSNLFHWGNVTETTINGEQRIFYSSTPNLAGTYPASAFSGHIYEFGQTTLDVETNGTYDRAGEFIVQEVTVPYKVVISLGLVGRVDSEGRVICTDIVARRKQLAMNQEENSSSSTLLAVVRSEGEGLKHFDVSETDVEFQDIMLNAQQGVSENTKSVLNTLVLGASPAGSNAPLMGSEYFDTYARVNVPDEEGRAAYVDLLSTQTTEPHRLQISEIRVLGSVKGGSQREQS